ncbi:N-6 DNA methylase [Opitutales bacterium]|nr:N-6 DNA methylase [Opitutales bacterium]
MSAKTPESITLDHSIEIYIPTQCRCGQMLPEDVRAEVLDEVKGAMHGWFGGVSKKDDIRVEEIEGAWPLKSGEIANERVDVVYSNASAEALEEHFEELPALAASIANRLTQESIAFRVNNKMTLMPGQDVKPHRCAGGVSPGSLPVARQPNEKERMRAIQASLQRISSVRDARDLFCHVLHYEFKDEQIHTAQWPDNLKECLAPRTSPQIIADQNGFKILYLQLAEDYLRKGHERQVVQRIIKDDPTLRGLVVVSDIDQKEWHLVNAKFEKEDGKKERLRLRRMRVGPEQSVRTAVERLKDVDVEHLDEGITAAQLQDLHDKAFDVESVSKDFFNEISNWYFWALSEVEFPGDTVNDGDDEKHRATSLIRFLTRIIFCWFLKEKNLIPDSLFKEKDLTGILKDLDPDTCSYHQGILQNLFFATLNQRMGKDSKGQPYRAFAKDEGFLKNKSTYGVDTLYRYEEHFKDEGKALSYFADVPFLNGGLFECLDRTDDNGKKHYVDGFSRNKKKRARVPNELFFSREQTVDLSGKNAYGAAKFKKAKVRGLLNILHAYNFTVEENTPIDEEIALDPELLGKVFENLLASYNEETKTTARKQTGSFYTPRPIVEYMVDESLKAHLCGTLTKLDRIEAEALEQLDLLLGYTDEEPSFSEEEISALLETIHTCKILDPACGSGAFPIGMLQKLVHIVHKLDPENDKFEAIQIKEAQKIEDRNERRKQIEQIGKDFSENDVDYGRKLYLIENCLYGVDIQPIAIQISKLRFFISLICDQKTNRDKAKNHGIRPLPNLETKFVAANTLIGLPEMDQMALVDPRVNKIEAEIEALYHRHFSIQRRDQKLVIQSKLKELRKELGQVLAESLGSSQKAQHLAEWDPFDSQTSSDFFDPHWMFGRELAEGFDIVIGNPPYINIEKISPTDRSLFLSLYGEHGKLGKRYDIYQLFIMQAINTLSAAGILAFIIPNTFLMGSSYLILRKRIVTRTKILHVVDLPQGVFENATVDNVLLFLQSGVAKAHGISIATLNSKSSLNRVATRDWDASFTIRQGALKSDDAYKINVYLNPTLKSLFNKVEADCVRLGDATESSQGIILYKTAADAKDANYTGFSKQKGWHKLLRGKNIGYYCTKWGGEYVHYGNWLWCQRDEKYFNQPKILLHAMRNKALKRRLVGTLDFENHYNAHNLANIIEKPGSDYDLRYILAVFNSKLINYWYRNHFPNVNINPNDLRQIPIHVANKQTQKPFVELVGQILSLKEGAPDADTSSIERETDARIYELYGLSKPEIQLIEESI